MEAITIIGSLAAVLTTIASMPQTYKIIRDKTTEGISVATYGILLCGTGLWVVYGIMDTDWPVIIANGISSLTSIAIIILYFISDKKIKQLHEKILPEEVQEEVRREEAGKPEKH